MSPTTTIEEFTIAMSKLAIPQPPPPININVVTYTETGNINDTVNFNECQITKQTKNCNVWTCNNITNFTGGLYTKKDKKVARVIVCVIYE
jgi:hypothetical protein